MPRVQEIRVEQWVLRGIRQRFEMAGELRITNTLPRAGIHKIARRYVSDF